MDDIGPLKASGSGSEVTANQILVREMDTYKEAMSPSSIIRALEQYFQDHKTEHFLAKFTFSRRSEVLEGSRERNGVRQ